MIPNQKLSDSKAIDFTMIAASAASQTHPTR